MLKYVDTKVVFAEIPDEICLAVNISGCPIRCPDCHSKYLWDSIGKDLTFEELSSLIQKNKGVSCVLFMGGDREPQYIKELAEKVHNTFNLKVACYFGSNTTFGIEDALNYIKIGPFIKALGPLDSPTTNQRLYKIIHQENNIVLKDITSMFWKSGS